MDITKMERILFGTKLEKSTVLRYNKEAFALDGWGIMKPKTKALMKMIGWVLLIAVVAAVAYVSYVWFSYSRIDDNRALVIENNPEASLSAGRELSALTYNIGFGAYTPDYSFFMDGGRHARAYDKETVERLTAGAISTISQYDPELVILQEIDVDADRSHQVNQVTSVTQALSDYASVFAFNYDSAYLLYPFHEPIGKTRSGILSLSKYKIESATRRQLPVETGFNKFFDLDRCFTVLKMPVDNGRTLTLINIHASAYTDDESVRNAQTEMLMQAIDEAYKAGDYVICGGDFNRDLHGGKSGELFGFDNPGEPWLTPMDEAKLPAGFRVVPSENAGTVRDTSRDYIKGETFEAIIDGFIVSDNVDCLSAQTIDTGYEYSDHNPVLLRFVLEEIEDV